MITSTFKISFYLKSNAIYSEEFLQERNAKSLVANQSNCWPENTGTPCVINLFFIFMKPIVILL